MHIRCFQVGDLVLKRILPPQTDHRGKWTPNYDGPYIVTKIFDGGALMLATMDVTAGLANTGFIECQTGCCDIHPCQQILRNRTVGVLLELSIYFQSSYQGNTRPGIRPTD
ncbi:hypothetical protein KIW84_041401 [Lathyrus oleraceus]|uniref:Uncharacterized protein n=1 Tax=Pisum sativum TaxID=3888 RepID=A0A9D4XA00_PEA|nr:hypothetical protein KIW84_041401 [Pisum sativum]